MTATVLYHVLTWKRYGRKICKLVTRNIIRIFLQQEDSLPVSENAHQNGDIMTQSPILGQEPILAFKTNENTTRHLNETKVRRTCF
jgi:hypothetical protein